MPKNLTHHPQKEVSPQRGTTEQNRLIQLARSPLTRRERDLVNGWIEHGGVPDFQCSSFEILWQRHCGRAEQ